MSTFLANHSLYSYAHAYLTAGLFPFPLNANMKTPAISGGHNNAARDLQHTDSLFANHAGNIGITFGPEHFVLDLDIKGGKNGIEALAKIAEQHGGLPPTLTQRTPTGGQHLVFRKPAENNVPQSVDVLAEGIDIRTSKGYIVAAPSTIGGNPYGWIDWEPTSGAPPTIADAPKWLLDLLVNWKKPQQQSASIDFTNSGKIGEGGRNAALASIAGAMRRQGCEEPVILAALASHNAAHCSPPLPLSEVNTIAHSIAKYEAEGAKTVAEPYRLLSAAELCNAAPMRWMVRGLLPMEGLAALYGESGSGKSFLMLDMACAVACGSEWFGRRVTQAPVTYVCLEGEAGMGKRIKAWGLHYKAPVPDALRFITQPFDLLSANVKELATAINAGGGSGGLVIVDTLNRAAPGADENSSVDMGKIIAAAKLLQSLTGGLVCLVHHTGKDASKGLRGHSSLYASLDGAIKVAATGTQKSWSVDKSKDDVGGVKHAFKLDVVIVDFDEDIDSITSCVILPDESHPIHNGKKTKLRSNQKIANDVLTKALRDQEQQSDGVDRMERATLRYDEAVALVAEKMPTDPKHKNTRSKDAIASLVANGFFTMQGDELLSNHVDTY